MRILSASKILLLIGLAFCGAASRAEIANDSGETFEYPYKNGLYATIAGYLQIQKVKVPGAHQRDLIVPSFKKPMPILEVCQNHVAPLVVIVLGLDGKVDSPLGQLWPAWFANNGYHVLTFDSTCQQHSGKNIPSVEQAEFQLKR